MKKLDPLYIMLLSAVVLVVSIVLFNKSISGVEKSQSELININNIALSYSQMKKDWGNSQHTIKVVDKMIASVGIKILDKKITKKKIKIKIDKISLKKIDKFVNKILNEKLNILKLNITNNSINLEVGI